MDRTLMRSLLAPHARVQSAAAAGHDVYADFLMPEDPRWAELLSTLDHDFYHLAGYTALAARQEGGEAIGFLAAEGERRFFLPLILRPVDPALAGGAHRFDATCPYGYPGPLLSEGATAGDFPARAVAALTEGLRRRGVVAAFIRLHPLLPFPLAPLAGAGRLVQHGETIAIDLSCSAEEFWRQTRRDHRKDINRARRQGHVARIDERWEHFDDFLEIYRQTMRRLAAHDSYFFSRDYFLELRQILGDGLHLSIVEIDGQVAGAGLVTETGGIVQNHLSGTRAEFVAASPEKLRVDFLRGWAKGRGDRVFHLGGGLGGRADALFQFKAGFSDRRHPFWTWRLVTDPPAYRRLVEAWQARHDGAAPDPDGFFPAYRAPRGAGTAGGSVR